MKTLPTVSLPAAAIIMKPEEWAPETPPSCEGISFRNLPGRLALLLSVFFALCGSAQALVWIERHNMSSATLQSEFDLWTAAPYGYRMTRLTGSETAGSDRYAAIFEQSTKTTGWAARNGMTSSDFVTYHNSIHLQGYRLIWLDAFGVGSTAHYNGIWEQTSGPSQRLRVGESLSSHQSADSTNNAAG